MDINKNFSRGLFEYSAHERSTLIKSLRKYGEGMSMLRTERLSSSSSKLKKSFTGELSSVKIIERIWKRTKEDMFV